MITNKIICTICARGGSKRLKNKNLLLIKKLPLIAHTIQQAKKTKIFDVVSVSSDSKKLLDISRKFGADVLIKRDRNLSNDSASKLLAIKDCVIKTEKQKKIKYDFIVDLDVTSPLRKIIDIKNCIKKIIKSKKSNIFSVTDAKHSPYFNMVEIKKNKVKISKNYKSNKINRMQDSPEIYEMNASIYVWNRNIFIKNPKIIYFDTMYYKMPRERSIDIDTKLDYQTVKFLSKKSY